MADLVLLGNPYFLIVLAADLLLWITGAKKHSLALTLPAVLVFIAILTLGALHGAGYEELTVVLLAFIIPGVIAYDGHTEAKK